MIPVYNAEKFLVETIESVLNQSLKEFELILIN
ncbi:glycosyltransferase, partial [Chryseobacterium sp. CH1]